MKEAITRTAMCSCGQLRVVVEGEPVRVSVCHCRACQRRTGSAFGVQARWHKDKVRVEGETHVWRRVGDEGTTQESRFCPQCGATVWFTQDVTPDLVGVAVGAFGDPTFPAPTRSVYDEYRHPWVELPGTMERF
jgi:hypothetical protein